MLVVAQCLRPEHQRPRCVAIATGEPISDVEGGSLRLTAGSICVHGDTAGAVGIARRVREALAGAGITLAPFVK